MVVMKCLLVLLVVLSSKGVFTTPAMKEEGPGCSSSGCADDSMQENRVLAQEDLDEILENALMNSTDNLERIKAFTLQPDEVKLCISVNYTITCTDNTNCQVADMNCTNNCSIMLVWTSLDTQSFAGSILYHYASEGLEFPGFEWNGACDLTENSLMLIINVPTMLMMLDNRTDQVITLQKGLKALTIKLPLFANSSNAEKSHSIEHSRNIKFLIATIILSCLFSFTLFCVGKEVVYDKVVLKNGKIPKSYYQFWALTIVCLFLLVWSIYSNPSAVITYVVFYVLVHSFISLTDIFHNVITMSIKSILLKMIRSCLVKIAYAFTIFAVYSIPSILMIYYLYPIQTLTGLPFLINSILYVNSLIALLIYQVERLVDFSSPVPNIAAKDYQSAKGLEKKIKHFLHTVYQPITTSIALIFLIIYIITIYSLSKIEKSGYNSKDHIVVLFTVLPSLLLLFGSVYKLDFFFSDIDDEPKKSERKLLAEVLESNQLILKEIKKTPPIVDLLTKLLESLKESNSRGKLCEEQSRENGDMEQVESAKKYEDTKWKNQVNQRGEDNHVSETEQVQSTENDQDTGCDSQGDQREGDNHISGTHMKIIAEIHEHSKNEQDTGEGRNATGVRNTNIDTIELESIV